MPRRLAGLARRASGPLVSAVNLPCSPIPSSPYRVTVVDPSHSAGLGTDPAARRRSSLFRTLPVTGLFVVAIALFVWWWLRDTRSGADLRMIETWMRNGEYGLARHELRGHLRRSPRDGAARMMLARVLAADGDLAGLYL